MDTVQTVPLREGTPDIDFTFAPHAGAYSYSVDGNVYSPSNAFLVNINTTITFTASAEFPDATSWATAYEWDFGDGIKGYGSPATHAYQTVNPDIQVVLLMIDNHGKRWRARNQLYLQ